MKRFAEIAKLTLMGWGFAAFAVAVGSLINAERVTTHLLQITMIYETVITLTAYLLFSSRKWEINLWVKRIIVSLFSGIIGYALFVITGLSPASWQLCAVFAGSAAASFIAFLIADMFEKRTLAKINEELEENE
ncbi:MAG: hypothetical protein IKX19_12550 [Clostridia bacterium]|nr:hypothetical protein [Clostridia bacterium]MBR5681473.1 hypothetical protein [Clostridia bacterium]